MSTGTFLAESALKRIGKHSIVQPAEPEDIEDTVNILGPMLQLWLSRRIDIGIVPLSAPGLELGEPADTTNAIIDNLAMQIAPNYRVAVSQDLKDNARRGFSDVKRLYQVNTIPGKVVSSTLPRGSGNRQGIQRRIFSGSGHTLPSKNG